MDDRTAVGQPITSKSHHLRTALSARHFSVGVGAHDAVGARLVERAGFDFIWASGLAVSASYGVPDASILGMERFLDAARVLNSASTLPVVADCDTGFGSVNNAIYMAEQYCAAGIAAICVEDKIFPKRNSFTEPKHELEPIEAFSNKLRAIRRAVGLNDLTLIARTETYISGGSHEEALRRAHAYADAGADALLVHSKLKDCSEIEAFSRDWRDELPIIIVPTTYTRTPFSHYKSMGISAVICANQLLRASILQMDAILCRLRANGKLSDLDDSICGLNDLVSMFAGSKWVDL